VAGTGIRFWPVTHSGRTSRSSEEAETVAGLVEALLGRAWTDRHGATRPLTLDDIVVVAPYNAQVAEIHRAIEGRIGSPGRVGTVDKFQGQEAAVAIYSTATSSPDDAPRDLEFLYSGNRLNVAVSRARGLAILVANPDLFIVHVRTPEQMRLVNAFCRLVQVADEQAAARKEAKVSPA
jgi:superfamily I DNA and/or RNA helicase